MWHVAFHWVRAWTSQPQWCLQTIFSFSPASKPPNQSSRQSPVSSLVLPCLHVADPSAWISTQLPVHVSPDSSPPMLLNERICSLLRTNLSSHICLDFCKPSLLSSSDSCSELTETACQIASPGCLHFKQFWSSFLFQISDAVLPLAFFFLPLEAGASTHQTSRHVRC